MSATHSSDGMVPPKPIVSHTPARDSRATVVQRQPDARRHWWWAIIVIVLIVLVGVGGWLYMRSNTGVDANRYQAVFLTNNQVYFGKLHGYGTPHPSISGVYYIKNQDTTAAPDVKKTNTNSQLQLVKLSDAIHKPDDTMLLNTSQILFVENLQKDSQIVKLMTSGK